MLPDYLFIGPTKSATTWIDAYLRSRDDVVLPADVKETLFFDKQYQKGLDWYEGHFKPSPQSKICVEVAPSLLGKPYAAQRVARDLPNVEVICTLRNPIDRAVSHYFHYIRAGAKDVGFFNMCQSNIGIILVGLYYKNILNWTRLLGPERVHFLMYEEMVDDLESFCGKLCGILHIPYTDPRAATRSKVNEAGMPRYRMLAYAARHGADRLRRLGGNRLVNAAKFNSVMKLIYGSRPSVDHRQRIREEAEWFYDTYRRDYEQLEAMAGIDLSAWKTPLDDRGAVPAAEASVAQAPGA